MSYDPPRIRRTPEDSVDDTASSRANDLDRSGVLLTGWHVLAAVLAAWTLAVSMPLLDLLGRNGPFLVAHDLQSLSLVAYLATLVLGAPALLAAFPVIVKDPRSRRLAVTVVVGLLLSVAVLTIGARTSDLPGLLLVPASAVLGGVAAHLAVSTSPGRRFLALVGVLGPLAVAVQFTALAPAGSLVLGAAGDEVGTTVGDPTPVFVVLLDEFPLTSLLTPDGHVDAELFPGFAELADSATWFPHATTFGRKTAEVVPQLLTGRRVDARDLMPVPADHPDDLFSLLEGTDILAVEPITRMCAVDSCRVPDGAPPGTPWRVTASDTAIVFLHQVLPADLATSLPAVDEGWVGFAGSEPPPEEPELDEKTLDAITDAALVGDSTASAEAFVASIADATSSSLYFGHFLLPHSPFEHLPDGRQLPRAQARDPALGWVGTWGSDPWLVGNTYRRHLLKVRYTDKVVDDIVTAIRGRGLWDEAMVVVMSDHGATFRTDTKRRAEDTPGTVADVLHVPLFIKYPGQQRGVRSPYPASLIDVTPTIAEALELTPRPDYDGTVLAQDGDVATVGSDDAWQEVLRASSRKYQQFGLDDADDLYAFGMLSQLVGTATEQLDVADADPVDVVLDVAGDLRDIPRDVRILPAVLDGSLPGWDPETPPAAMLFSIDGTVAGNVEPYVTDEGEVRFHGLLDPTYLTPGQHEVEAWVLEDAAGSLLLPATVG